MQDVLKRKEKERKGGGYLEQIDQVKRILQYKYEKLTSNQKRLADYIYENPHRVALMSSSEFATELGLSESTIVRFAQALGFIGYPDLRELLREQLMREVSYSERVATVMQEQDSKGSLHQVITQSISYLNQLTENITESDLHNAVQLIDQAKRIFVCGEGAAGSSAQHLDFWLTRLGCQVTLVHQTGRRFYDYIFDASAGDLAIIFAFRRSSAEPLALLEILTERAGRSILITDLPGSPLHSLATVVLTVQRGSTDRFRPLGPVTAIVDALTLELIKCRGEAGVERIKQLDNIRERYGVLDNEKSN